MNSLLLHERILMEMRPNLETNICCNFLNFWMVKKSCAIIKTKQKDTSQNTSSTVHQKINKHFRIYRNPGTGSALGLGLINRQEDRERLSTREKEENTSSVKHQPFCLTVKQGNLLCWLHTFLPPQIFLLSKKKKKEMV